MAYAGANAWSAAGEAAQNWARLLGQLYQGQQQQKQLDADRKLEGERYDADVKYRGERDKLEDTHRGTMEGIANANSRREAIEGGWQPFSALGRALVGPIAGGIPGAAIPTPGIDPAAMKAPSTEIGGEKMAYMPQPKTPEKKFQEVRMGDGVYAVDMASGGADRRRLGDLPPQSIPPVNLQVVPTDTGLGAFDPRKGTITPVKGEGGGQVQAPAKAGDGDDELESSLTTLRTLAANPSPAGDVAFGYAFMKLLEPTSIVTDRELKILGAAAGLKTKFQSAMQRAKTGTGLTPEQRADYLKQAEAIAQARKEARGGGSAPQTGGRSAGAGGSPPAGDVWTRIQNDPNLSPEEKASLLAKRPRR